MSSMTMPEQGAAEARVGGAVRRVDGGGDDLASLQFRAFVAALNLSLAEAVSLPEANGRVGAERISRQLLQLIELQALEAGRIGAKSGDDTVVAGRFLKAALADELLLHTDWSGRAHWRHVLLEAQLFNSSLAGQKVFDEIEQLLHERDPGSRDVARLYLHLLSLGFLGRYRDSVEIGRIGDYRRRLFQFAYQRPADLSARDIVLTEQPYASTLSYSRGRRLPRLTRGGVTFLLAMLFLLGLSEVLWLWQSWPVRAALTAPPRAAPATTTVAAPVAEEKGLPC